MRIYWYWPFARSEELALATAAVRPGDELMVHTVAHRSRPHSGEYEGFHVVADLPEVRQRVEGSARWYLSRPRTYVQRATRRRRAVAAGQFDVVHVMFHNYFTDWLALGNLHRRAVLVSSVHDVVPHEPRLPARLQSAILQRLYHRGGHLVVHHASLKDRLVEEFMVPGERVSVIPLQVPPASSMPVRRDLRSKRTREVLFFGTFRRNKGIEVLVEAIALLAKRDDLRFRFAGRGFDDMERLVLLAASRDPRVTAEIGWIPSERKEELLGQADLLVLPYTSFSSQSAVLHDAYAHGIPVVTTDVGALGRTVREDASGWVVEPGDAQPLARAIDAALRDCAAYLSAAVASQSIGRARHPTVVGGQLRALYERLIDERAAGAGASAPVRGAQAPFAIPDERSRRSSFERCSPGPYRSDPPLEGTRG